MRYHAPQKLLKALSVHACHEKINILAQCCTLYIGISYTACHTANDDAYCAWLQVLASILDFPVKIILSPWE